MKEKGAHQHQHASTRAHARAQVTARETRTSFSHYATQLCAIIGGSPARSRQRQPLAALSPSS